MIKQNDKRFEFGKNWQDFLSVLDDERIRAAKESLQDFLGPTDLKGKKFLDIGSGSGLLSLTARQLRAKVHSFDYDEKAVECTNELKRRYFYNDPDWYVEKGSILDTEYIERLGQFDICYAWGVLHHTGNIWQALYNAQLPLREGGLLFIGIYNDQGPISSIWKIVKKAYCSGRIAQILITLIFYPLFFMAGLLIDVARLRNPARRYREHKVKYRGMSLIHDWKDWLGGYPYEYAKPDKIISFLKDLGYDLCKFKATTIGFGNNQYLFKKIS